MAGTEGFEPTRGGIKTRCLTTWLRPNRIKEGWKIYLNIIASQY